ncbi:nicotinamidase-related amidase [Actinomadura coerulea]|uniref:Nicotinamidase-related amidase n=1 Tax=Actinomadura coerulea TaxID=46159 RepID=A0A7X0FWJ2_9ACTN|nr:isochorismatase family protein [Actinomadura coerulea]MBB6395019.1 nicotinamidase-related amidase [Actinomadura coerulea]GGQ14215.1 hydrolase [Actinomadura coerulea]
MNRALLVIDVQESFRRRPNWEAVSAPDIADRAAGDLVVWILHAEPGSGGAFDPGLGHVRLMDGLAPEPGEPVMTKTSRNAFTTTGLQQLLTERGVGEVAVCGIQTEQCCETTARLAADLGYRVTFVTDATATFPIEHRDAPPGRALAEILADPATLPTDQIIARTEYALAGRFAAIASLDDLAPAPVR